MRVLIYFNESNAGGDYRLEDEHYQALRDTGWHDVKGIDPDNRYAGRSAYLWVDIPFYVHSPFRSGEAFTKQQIETLAYVVATKLWAQATGLDPGEPGCNCGCRGGPPFYFMTEETEDA